MKPVVVAVSVGSCLLAWGGPAADALNWTEVVHDAVNAALGKPLWEPWPP